ncbi:hypothetical protein [Pelagibacterium limicola]|uniref:hypothetical protein n=1 Tax=Pelagibacterium limicola TaxID=2791022 RepID=UPI0018AF6FB3|nr:hypothetical protein [Pelagibacterium limicola]
MSAATPEIRHAIYARLARHNRRIGMLRVAVPVIVVAILSVPIVQVVFATLADSFPIAGIRLDADTLVIDAPRFDGRTATGTVYRMTADRAESRIGNLDIADLYDLRIDLSDGADYSARVGFTTAQWTMSQERLVSNEDVHVADSTGASGILAGIEIDWPSQVITSDGPVHFVFEGGNRLDAATMVHDMGAAIWQFEGVRLEMIPAPDDGRERDPFAEEAGQ